MRRQFSFGRLGRRLGGVLGVALAAALVHWFQGQRSQLPAAPAGQSVPAASGAGSAVPPGRYTLTGTVAKVADGDTVTLRVGGSQHRVRLDSIDAPEAGHSAQEPGQPYAQASQRHLERLVGGKTLTAQCYEQDQFKRDVCALMLPDGSSANRAQVAAGYAWAYTARRGDYLHDTAMPELQRQARQAGMGLWAQAGATEPWKWRYECWRNQRCQ
ncbi:MAG TPA: thermonuclease family protein [Bordetella sp.]|nr:thermonuclease family protein [Bordetella sp.]